MSDAVTSILVGALTLVPLGLFLWAALVLPPWVTLIPILLIGVVAGLLLLWSIGVLIRSWWNQ